MPLLFVVQQCALQLHTSLSDMTHVTLSRRALTGKAVINFFFYDATCRLQ